MRVSLSWTWTALLFTMLVSTLSSCRRERDMPERSEMPDSMPVVRAMSEPGVRDSMLDVLPGGEMARGDSAAATKWLKKKM